MRMRCKNNIFKFKRILTIYTLLKYILFIFYFTLLIYIFLFMDIFFTFKNTKPISLVKSGSILKTTYFIEN